MPKENLDEYIGGYTDFNGWMADKRYAHYKQYYTGKTSLELGPAEGQGTAYLLDHFDKVVSVDGSQSFIDRLNEMYGKNPKFKAVCSYFEDLELDETFDTIVLGHILEHVDNPGEVLKIAGKFLSDKGVIIADVPNGDSLHRQLGVKMGLIARNTELNDSDKSVGHKRVYTPDTFRAEVEQAGFKIIKFGGVLIKIVSNTQMQEQFSEEQLNAMVAVGVDNPEIAADIFIVASQA